MAEIEMLTKNFSVSEFACKCCGVNGMIPVFMSRLQSLRDIYGRPMVITSGYRCEKHNTAIGGHKNSQHKFGLACDIHCLDSNERYKMVEIAVGLGFRGVGVAKTFLHLDLRGSQVSHLWLY